MNNMPQTFINFSSGQELANSLIKSRGNLLAKNLLKTELEDVITWQNNNPEKASSRHDDNAPGLLHALDAEEPISIENYKQILIKAIELI